jgi:hypothetical protein
MMSIPLGSKKLVAVICTTNEYINLSLQTRIPNPDDGLATCLVFSG